MEVAKEEAKKQKEELDRIVAESKRFLAESKKNEDKAIKLSNSNYTLEERLKGLRDTKA